MRNIKLILEYDGSAFFGFQKQPGKPTVQEALEKALSAFFDKKMKISAASGRTDTGVHAEGQVVNFKTESDRDLKRIQKGLNAHLSPPVVVKSVEGVPADFHARYSARSKVYEYRIWNHPFRSPLLAARTCHVPYRLDLAAMRKAAKHFIGRHDFRSFTSEAMVRKGRANVSFVRTIQKLLIKKESSLIRIRVEADGFLYHMVRNLVGTLLEVGKGKLTPEAVPGLLRSRDRRAALGATVSPVGLTLLHVHYEEKSA